MSRFEHSDEPEWSYEPVNVSAANERDDQFIGAYFPSGSIDIEVENGVVNVPIGLLFRCKLFVDLFEYSV